MHERSPYYEGVIWGLMGTLSPNIGSNSTHEATQPIIHALMSAPYLFTYNICILDGLESPFVYGIAEATEVALPGGSVNQELM